MDTTNFGAPPGTDLDPRVMWRAITNPAIHTVAYLLIIVWERLTAIVLIVAAWQWVVGLRAGTYALARRWASVGLTMIVVLFMGVFIAIGGEWFQMWRSTEWDGESNVLQYALLALLS